MPVIIDNGFGGLLFHEACGHSLEASSVAKGTWELSGRSGEQIASPLVTLIGDGSLANEWGSLAIDDEGTPTQENVLIENGILRGYLVDKLSGRRMGIAPTGSARRKSYCFAPVSRMTNTYIANGTSTRDDIIANTEHDLFVKYINGGSVNPVTGEFKRDYKEKSTISPTNLFLHKGELALVELKKQMGEGLLIVECDGMFAGADPVSGDFSLISKGYLISVTRQSTQWLRLRLPATFLKCCARLSALAMVMHLSVPKMALSRPPQFYIMLGHFRKVIVVKGGCRKSSFA